MDTYTELKNRISELIANGEFNSTKAELLSEEYGISTKYLVLYIAYDIDPDYIDCYYS